MLSVFVIYDTSVLVWYQSRTSIDVPIFLFFVFNIYLLLSLKYSAILNCIGSFSKYCVWSTQMNQLSNFHGNISPTTMDNLGKILKSVGLFQTYLLIFFVIRLVESFKVVPLWLNNALPLVFQLPEAVLKVWTCTIHKFCTWITNHDCFYSIFGRLI